MTNSVTISSTLIRDLNDYANRLIDDINDIKTDRNTIQYEVLIANYEALMIAIQDIKEYSIIE